ncbi:MAG: hypothetical protein ACK55I_36390, partial [bacterium]
YCTLQLTVNANFALFPGSILNPILHTAWLNIHALTLKRNTAKYYFGKKIKFFAYLPKNLL